MLCLKRICVSTARAISYQILPILYVILKGHWSIVPCIKTMQGAYLLRPDIIGSDRVRNLRHVNLGTVLLWHIGQLPRPTTAAIRY